MFHGGNMPKGSPELTAARKEEIVNACEKLYQTMNFKDFTLKEIGKGKSVRLLTSQMSFRELSFNVFFL